MEPAQQEKLFMSIWTIYYDPRDYPGKYVTRRHDIFRDNRPPQASREHYVGNTLDEVRARIPLGLVRLLRSEGDEPQIVECWV